MDYFDWNLQENLIASAKALGWRAYSPKRFFVKHPGELRSVSGFCSVSSESSEALRQAAKKVKLIDVSRLKGFEKDVGLIRAVAERGAFFEMPLRVFLHEYGGYRAQRMQKYHDFIQACFKYGALLVFSSQAESIFDLKSPFEVNAILQQLSLTREQAEAVLTRKVLQP